MFNYISLHRVRKGFTQSQLGKMIGVSRNTISSLERNEFYPTLETALKLSIVLGVPVDSLFCFTLDEQFSFLSLKEVN